MLKGQRIYLRAVEPSDATKILLWENNPENWRVSGTEAPYSMHSILEYINSIQNFRQCGEQRFMICLNENDEAIGTLDLFEANFKHERVGLGILIADKNNRNQGYAKESIQIIIEYCFDFLALHSIFVNIHSDNIASLQLFESLNFNCVGEKKDWYLEKGKRINEKMYQLCSKKHQ